MRGINSIVSRKGTKAGHFEWLKKQGKDSAGCAIAGILCEDGQRISGADIASAMSVMHDRSNGLGGGFAAYGIYPETADQYAFHVMFDHDRALEEAADFLAKAFKTTLEEPIPTRKAEQIGHRPILRRFFLLPTEETRARYYEMTDDDIVVSTVMEINANIEGAFVFSSGKNMGVFKGVGYPEDIAEFYSIDDYRGYIWTGHGRFPTNTSGWWGGAHPFGLLDWSIVHNGEISSYGINKRYLANFGYDCALQTDTEVITYLFDLLVRKHELPMEAACMAMAPPLWEEIERMKRDMRELAISIRLVYGGALLNGPFSVLVGFKDGMVAFNDRIKLRPMVFGRHGSKVLIASEESAIRAIHPRLAEVKFIEGGVPVVATIKGHDHEKVA